MIQYSQVSPTIRFSPLKRIRRFTRRFLGVAILSVNLVSETVFASTPTIPAGIKGVKHSPVISVDTNTVLRTSAPTELFGFNVPWINFQHGYWRSGNVRKEVINWLRPFEGAVYRYPGGDLSNWYDWRKAIGPPAGRPPQHARWNEYDDVEFGFDEFIAFVKEVKGVPFVTVNMVGTNKEQWSDQLAKQQSADWLGYSVKREGPAASSESRYCEKGKVCPVRWWELGNELDWGDISWTAEQYTSRALIIGNAMLNVDPNIQLIAHTASSPWSQKRAKTNRADEFDKAVGLRLSRVVKGYSIHPYYDGINIADATGYMDKTINSLKAASELTDPQIFVTEHGRWPHKPEYGDWRPYWIQTGNLGGAISTADYVLSLMPNPRVRMAMWHALGTGGPWQLFYVDEKTDTVYPSVVYWALRTLRSGLLDHVVSTNVNSPNVSGYGGGYDIRAVALINESRDQLSLLVVNRARNVFAARVHVPLFAGRVSNVHHTYVSGSSLEAANTNSNQSFVSPQVNTYKAVFDSDGYSGIDIPPYSISAYIFRRKNGD